MGFGTPTLVGDFDFSCPLHLKLEMAQSYRVSKLLVFKYSDLKSARASQDLVPRLSGRVSLTVNVTF